MRQIVPLDPGGIARDLALEAEVIDRYVAAEDRPGTTGRPWVVVNMVASADGATYVDGVSGPLGGPGDFAVFVALRAAADVIVAGSATVTAERYRPPMGDAARRARRTERGQAPLPRLAVVSNRGDVDLSLPLFVDGAPDRRPIVIGTAQIPDHRRDEIADVADLLVAGETRVDMGRALGILGADHAARIVLVEGGATLNGLLLAEDLVDEWCLTVAPLLVAGTANRAAVGPPLPTPLGARLARVLEHEGELILRYVRDRGDTG